MKKYTIIIASFFLFTMQGACKPSNESNKEAETIAQKEQTPIQTETQNGLKRAYFASGCFWCVEAVYESVIGVKEADRKSTRLNSSHAKISYAVFCLKK